MVSRPVRIGKVSGKTNCSFMALLTRIFEGCQDTFMHRIGLVRPQINPEGVTTGGFSDLIARGSRKGINDRSTQSGSATPFRTLCFYYCS
jgi:hypothetical protein